MKLFIKICDPENIDRPFIFVRKSAISVLARLTKEPPVTVIYSSNGLLCSTSVTPEAIIAAVEADEDCVE